MAGREHLLVFAADRPGEHASLLADRGGALSQSAIILGPHFPQSNVDLRAGADRSPGGLVLMAWLGGALVLSESGYWCPFGAGIGELHSALRFDAQGARRPI